jgi:hypothetical protein
VDASGDPGREHRFFDGIAAELKTCDYFTDARVDAAIAAVLKRLDAMAGARALHPEFRYDA